LKVLQEESARVTLWGQTGRVTRCPIRWAPQSWLPKDVLNSGSLKCSCKGVPKFGSINGCRSTWGLQAGPPGVLQGGPKGRSSKRATKMGVNQGGSSMEIPPNMVPKVVPKKSDSLTGGLPRGFLQRGIPRVVLKVFTKWCPQSVAPNGCAAK
jgi:hypothetical protein